MLNILFIIHKYFNNTNIITKFNIILRSMLRELRITTKILFDSISEVSV